MHDPMVATEVLDDAAPYALRELCKTFGIEANVVVEMVEVGVLLPDGSEPSKWAFSATAVVRLQKARRMQRDLGINLAGVAVALDLLDDLAATRQKVRALESHLAQLTHYD